MTETWPQGDVPYEYPDGSQQNTQRWHEAIAKALHEGSLRQEPDREGQGKNSFDFYDLTGSCPRCGHATTQALQYRIVIAVAPLEEDVGFFNIICDCGEAHAERDDKHRGCGWAAEVVVELRRPGSEHVAG